MNPIRILKRFFINVDRSAQLLAEIREGVANMTDVMDRRLSKIASELETQQRSAQPLAGNRGGVADVVDRRLPEASAEIETMRRDIGDNRNLAGADDGNLVSQRIVRPSVVFPRTVMRA